MTSSLEAAASVDQGIDAGGQAGRSERVLAGYQTRAAPLLIGQRSGPATRNFGGRRWRTAAEPPGARGEEEQAHEHHKLTTKMMKWSGRSEKVGR